jgi:hypothetical protein
MDDPMSPAPTGSAPAERTGPNTRAIAVIVSGLLVIGVLVTALVVGGGSDPEPTEDVNDTSSLALDEPTPAETATTTSPDRDEQLTDEPDGEPTSDERGEFVVGPETEDLTRAAVLLLQLDDLGDPICFSGSGSLVSPDGKILTNAHVVADDPSCHYDRLGVALVETSDEPPRLEYLAEVVAFDEALDLAVARIATDLDGNPVEPVDLPHVAIGDSGMVGLGDSLRILGFPGIGGDTITFTRGAVSGFVAQRGVDDPRAWIKTDATIAGGNSGGMAVNEAGELVAIPTTAGAGDAAPTDCRVIEDTNLDGFIDDDDTCIPIGGFINGLRPVNLALTLLADADSAAPIEPVSPSVDPSTGFDVDQVEIQDVYFAPDVTVADQPTEIVDALPAGAQQVCAFWSYAGMRDGVTYDAIWRVDGIPDADASFVDDVWGGGESGEWWVCAINDTGLTDGLYEFELTVEGEFLVAETIFVGGNRQPASVTITNDSSDTICFVFISPTLSGYWGLDELGPTEVIEPSGTRVFDDLVTGRYDVSLRDCGLGVLTEWTGIDLTGEELLTHVA